jgi:outer membrane immunogenic protein
MVERKGAAVMTRSLVVAMLALGCLGTAAQAADWSEPAYNWTGLYVGGFAGGVAGDLTPYSSSNSGPSGLDAGLTLAYAWQTQGAWVFTPFVAVPVSGQTGEYAGSIPVRIEWAVVGGVKVGYATGRWQPYGFVAAVAGGGRAGSGGGAERHTHTGVSFGVGADYALNDRWSVGARYAHVSVGEQEYYSVPVGWQGNSFAATFAFKLQ